MTHQQAEDPLVGSGAVVQMKVASGAERKQKTKKDAAQICRGFSWCLVRSWVVVKVVGMFFFFKGTPAPKYQLRT